jgi:hypothetical protein
VLDSKRFTAERIANLLVPSTVIALSDNQNWIISDTGIEYRHDRSAPTKSYTRKKGAAGREPNESITPFHVRQIHGLILARIDEENAGQYREVPVRIAGSTHEPTPPWDIPAQMDDWGA